MTSLIATAGPIAMQCPDSTCAGKTFTCTGSYLCELDCTAMGSCVGTKLICGDGPCRLACGMMDCGMTTLVCGTNSCATTYFAPPDAEMGPVDQQTCSGSCDCTHNGSG